MKKIIFSIIAVALVGFLVYAVTYRKKEIPVEKPGKVTATTAYEKHFGPAPSIDKGVAYAFVIYFPSAKEPGKVVPFPFFSFDETSLKKVALQRLLDGMDVGSYKGGFQTFPAGTRLVSMVETQGTVTLTFSKELLTASDTSGKSGLLHSIVLTTKQFKGVNAVRIQTEGQAKILDVQGADGNAIAALSPPRLLSVTAMQDKGAKDVEEVNAFFDRPIDVKELRMSLQNGTPFEGDIYLSVCDMAAVLKPKVPSLFKAGLPVKVRWKVVDKLGRQAEGDTVMPLEVKQHDH
jgi:sporulation and spore germination protein